MKKTTVLSAIFCSLNNRVRQMPGAVSSCIRTIQFRLRSNMTAWSISLNRVQRWPAASGSEKHSHPINDKKMKTQESPRIFILPREKPWRRADGIPVTSTGAASFSETARPGEFFVFQVGLVAAFPAGPLRACPKDLRGDAGGTISASLIRNLSLGGIGQDGKPFIKD
ncbi:MAG: glycoside hydrolase domain-containing protein, partial [Victivallales bacterium]